MTTRVRGTVPTALQEIAQGEGNAAWAIRFQAARDRNDTHLKQAHEAVDIPVADCTQPDCKGSVMLESRYELANPDKAARHLGGSDPMKETLRCYCNKCGHSPPVTPPWLEALSVHRKR